MNSKRKQFTDSSFWFVPSLLTSVTILICERPYSQGYLDEWGSCQSFLGLQPLCKHTASQTTRENLLRPIVVVPFSGHLCWVSVRCTRLFLALVSLGTIGCCSFGLLHCLQPRSLLFSTIPPAYELFCIFLLITYPPLVMMMLVLSHTGETTSDGAGGWWLKHHRLPLLSEVHCFFLE